MIIRTHGKRKGTIELTSNERKAIARAIGLLSDIEMHASSVELGALAADCSGRLGGILDRLKINTETVDA